MLAIFIGILWNQRNVQYFRKEFVDDDTLIDKAYEVGEDVGDDTLADRAVEQLDSFEVSDQAVADMLEEFGRQESYGLEEYHEERKLDT